MWKNVICAFSEAGGKCKNSKIKKTFFGLGPRKCKFLENQRKCKHFKKKPYSVVLELPKIIIEKTKK